MGEMHIVGLKQENTVCEVPIFCIPMYFWSHVNPMCPCGFYEYPYMTSGCLGWSHEVEVGAERLRQVQI